MPFSIKQVQKWGLIILISIFLAITGFYSLYNNRITSVLNAVVAEDRKIASWIKIYELTNRASSAFHKIVAERSENVASVIFYIDALNNEINKLSQSEDVQSPALEEIRSSLRKFKSAVFGLSREVRDGYYGTSAMLMDKMALQAAEEILGLMGMAVKDSTDYIKDKNQYIILQTKRLNSLMLPALFAGMGLFIIVMVTISSLLIRYSNIFKKAIEEVAAGNLAYRIPGVYGQDMARLVKSFNQMLTDLQGAQAQIQKASSILNRVTEGLEEQLMLVDKDYKIIWANQKTAEVTGYKMEEILGSYYYKVLHGFDEPSKEQGYSCPLPKSADTRESCTVAHTHRKKDNQEFFAECSVYPLVDKAGEISEFIYTSRDITERIAMEERLKENVAALEKTKIDLERRMRQLEVIYEASMDRELMMVGLKKKIAELEENIAKRGVEKA